jgi:acylphosphatase
MMTRAHIFVGGIVQGVNFRYYTVVAATGLDLKGWVRNLVDGRVEVLCEGPEEKVSRMIEWCRKGPPSASVSGIDFISEEYSGGFKTFEIRY